MRQFVNDYLMNLRPYKTVPQEIWLMDKKEKEEVLKLDWNEATVEPTSEVKSAVLNFLYSEDFFHLYPATYNNDLMELLSEYAGVSKMHLQYFASSDALHEYFSKLFIKPGDKALILWPSYDNFRSTAEANGAKVFFSKMDSNFSFDLEKLKSDIKRESPKIAYVCNPNNPTGHFLDKEEIKDLIESNPDTMFLIDEAYAEFACQSVNELVLNHGNVCVSHTMSKAFGLANIRFGYLIASVDTVDLINRVRNPKNIPTLTQVAVIAALRHRNYMWEYVEEVNRAREWFLDKLRDKKIQEWIYAYPSRANFVLVKCRDMEIRSRIYYSLREHKIYVRQLSQSADLLCCIRITIGTQKQMEKVYQVLHDTLI